MEQYRPYNRNGYARNGSPQHTQLRYSNNYPNKDCSCNISQCEKNTDTIQMPIGMAYVPFQEFGELYDAHKGLMEGTMFPELNLIFCGVRG